MIEALERAAHLRIAKMVRAVEPGDPAGELLADAQVSRFPGHFFAHPDCAGGHARDSALFGTRC